MITLSCCMNEFIKVSPLCVQRGGTKTWFNQLGKIKPPHNSFILFYMKNLFINLHLFYYYGICIFRMTLLTLFSDRKTLLAFYTIKTFFRFIAANFFSFFAAIMQKRSREKRKHSFMCCRFEPSKTSSKPARERPSHCDAAPASGYFPASSSCQRLRGGAAPHAPASTSPSRTPLSFHRHSKLHATFGWLLPVARVRWLWENVENCSGMDVCTAAKSLLLLPSKHAVLEDCDFSPLRQGGCVCAVKRVICSSLPVIGVCV